MCVAVDLWTCAKILGWVHGYVHGAGFPQPDEPWKGMARGGCSVCDGCFVFSQSNTYIS